MMFFVFCPPSGTTLFPFTTLFRSDRARLHGDLARRDARAAVGRAPGDRRDRLRLAAVRQRAPGDRKSTRLNSSHGYISYAVFCLKKKIQVGSTADEAARANPRCPA